MPKFKALTALAGKLPLNVGKLGNDPEWGVQTVSFNP